MTTTILENNHKKRLDHPVWMLICFAMFCFWQMGFIYFMGPSLTINGRTPLPISMDNITTLIAVSYVMSILFMCLLPRFVIWAERITASTALATAVGLFLPLSNDVLRTLIYTQVFCCCFMIGFETFVIANYFTEKCAVRHLTVAYGVSLLLIAAVQNEFVPITFRYFRSITIIALVLMLVFFFRMPAGKESCPQYVKKSDWLISPKKLLIGTFILIFVSSLMAVSGPAIVSEMPHGVFITYCSNAFASFLIYFLYKKAKIHPLRTITIFIGLGCVGFLLTYVTNYIPTLSPVACILIGFGMVPCMMLPLYNVILMKMYPSRFLSPITIGLALVAVLIQSSMVELFRNAASMLCLAYAVIMVVLAIVYLQIEPFFLYTLHRNTDKPVELAEGKSVDTEQVQSDMLMEEEELATETVTSGEQEFSQVRPTTVQKEIPVSDTSLSVLTNRELEVVNLICHGYTNGDIAKMLFISEHTVKDHTKNIYRKMNVHSRFELAAHVNRLRENTLQ